MSIIREFNTRIGDNENTKNERRKQREEETDDLKDENRLKSKISDDFNGRAIIPMNQLIADRRKCQRYQESTTIERLNNGIIQLNRMT